MSDVASIIGVMTSRLTGKVALVAGATRGAGRAIAVQLGAVGATVYATGRSTRTRRSEMDRPENIEETGELIDAAGGHGIAAQVDHLDSLQVEALVARIDREQGRLDVLVNDVWAVIHSRNGTRRYGSIRSPTGYGCCGSQSTPT